MCHCPLNPLSLQSVSIASIYVAVSILPSPALVLDFLYLFKSCDPPTCFCGALDIDFKHVYLLSLTNGCTDCVNSSAHSLLLNSIKRKGGVLIFFMAEIQCCAELELHYILT